MLLRTKLLGWTPLLKSAPQNFRSEMGPYHLRLYEKFRVLLPYI